MLSLIDTIKRDQRLCHNLCLKDQFVTCFIFRSPSKKTPDSRKRERSASSAKFEVPAAKMARATGADPSRESKFLEESFKKKERR